MAINLANALRDEGVDVQLWSPFPIAKDVKWYRLIHYFKQRLGEFVAREGPFDIIDAPANAISWRLTRGAFVVARSVQPQILYQFAWDPAFSPKGPGDWTRRLVHHLYSVYILGHLMLGWVYADKILCLGSLELRLMRTWFPWWARKLASYVNALSERDRLQLCAARRAKRSGAGRGLRFIWIGRWTPHKGITSLLSFVADRLRTHPSDSFTIAGCGNDAKGYIPQCWIETARVRVLPAYSREELPKLLSCHDIGLFTSYVEGWGLVLNEMLEAGLVVYATSAGGVVDLAEICGSALRPFPPPDDVSSPAVESSVDWTRYDKLFCWSAIAKNYLQMLKSPYEGADVYAQPAIKQ